MTRPAHPAASTGNASRNLADLRSALAAAVLEVPPDQVPELIGVLMEMVARAQARLVAPVQDVVTHDNSRTADEIAAAFNVPVSQVYELARQGRIPCVRLGKYRRFDLEDVRRALASGEGSKSPALRLRKPRKKRSDGAASEASSAAATRLLPRAGGGHVG